MNARADLAEHARQIRLGVLRMVVRAGGGHIAPAFSSADILSVLYFHALRIDPARPTDPDRDRFILSKGHGCAALYAALARRGFFPPELLDSFCQPGGKLGGHPDRSIPGVEVCSGSLGHGLSLAVGLALAARFDASARRTFVLMSDGECHQGSVWEAALAAAHHKLSGLTVVVDYNKLISLGPIRDIVNVEPLADKWRAFGWAVREVDGHDVGALADTLDALPLAPDRPALIVAHTVKGKGVSYMEHRHIWHYRAPNAQELAVALAELGG